MDSSNLEARVQLPEQLPENPRLRWLSAIPLLALAGAVTVSIYANNTPEVRAERAFTAKYSDVHAGRKDVNGDGEFEYVISYRNPSTREQEQRILQFPDGQPILRRFEVQSGKIIYLD